MVEAALGVVGTGVDFVNIAIGDAALAIIDGFFLFIFVAVFVFLELWILVIVNHGAILAETLFIFVLVFNATTH